MSRTCGRFSDGAMSARVVGSATCPSAMSARVVGSATAAPGCVVGDSQGSRRRGRGANTPPVKEMPESRGSLYVSVSDSDDGFDDLPDVDGWGFGFGT
jgi:hypothetical protein